MMPDDNVIPRLQTVFEILDEEEGLMVRHNPLLHASEIRTLVLTFRLRQQEGNLGQTVSHYSYLTVYFPNPPIVPIACATLLCFPATRARLSLDSLSLSVHPKFYYSAPVIDDPSGFKITYCS
jgi:hypothetical protein